MIREKLQKARLNAGFNYREMADAIGMTKSGYWMIENGKRNLNYPMAVKIALTLGTTPDSIFLGSELTKEEQEEAAK